MPIYVYKCPMCKKEYLDYQHKYVGTRSILCPNRCFVILQRDYQAERAAIIPDWEPGYNPGIDYNYKNKADLLSEIKRRGFYPSVHGGGVSVGGTKGGLYGDEEYKNLLQPSEPENIEGLTNEPPLIK